MSTNPTPAEITKARAVIEFTDAREDAVGMAADLIILADAIENQIARGHFNLAAIDLENAAARMVETFKRGAEARDKLWEIQAAEKRAAYVAEAADTKAEAAK